MSSVDNLDERVRLAVRHFWAVRQRQAAAQGRGEQDARDRGQRGAVTGGKQMDGFSRLILSLLIESGLSRSMVYCKARPEGESPPPRTRRRKPEEGPRDTQTQLPGWFRAEKDWDLVIIVSGTLVGAIEYKSQVGSFGNNFNNRCEESIGVAADFKAAYREGAYKPSPKPWIGYLMLLEDARASRSPVQVVQPHFRVFQEFLGASYARRYEILLTKMVRDQLYDSACLIMTPAVGGLATGEYTEPNPELSFRNFATSLVAHAIATARMHPAPAASVQPETLVETAQAGDKLSSAPRPPDPVQGEGSLPPRTRRRKPKTRDSTGEAET
jgi:hypothetical protein